MVNTVPSNHTHADAELVERARIYRYLLARAERVSSTLASLALEQAAEAIDEGEHHKHHAALLDAQTGGVDGQPAPSGGWGDCWAELIEAVGPNHPLHEEMRKRRAAGFVRYGQPVRRDDGRDSDRDLLEELLDAAVYAQRLGLTSLARELLTLATDPPFHDEVFASLHSDATWAENEPVSSTSSVLAEVRIERGAQDAKWGEQNHADPGRRPHRAPGGAGVGGRRARRRTRRSGGCQCC